jgi:predicted nucleotidyltransferase component of viral defense system
MLDLSMMPQKPRAVFQLLANESALKPYILVGGTALSLQIHHCLSEDLDFCLFSERLNVTELDTLIAQLSKSHKVLLMTPTSKITQAKINGTDLLDYTRDYLIDGTKVTFFARNDVAYDYFSGLDRMQPDKVTFSLLSSLSIFKMKAWLIQKRVKSRDLFDLMQMIKCHHLSINNIFMTAQEADPAIFSEGQMKDILTGLIPVNSDDEGFESIGLDIDLQEVYTFFTDAINEDEIRQARELRNK